MNEVKRPMEFWIKRGTYEGDAFSSVDNPATYSTILDAPLEEHEYFEFQKKSFEENDMVLDTRYIHVIEKSHADKLQADAENEINSWVEKANSLSDFWNEDRIKLATANARLEKCEALLMELESKIVFNSENQSKIDQYFAENKK